MANSKTLSANHLPTYYGIIPVGIISSFGGLAVVFLMNWLIGAPTELSVVIAMFGFVGGLTTGIWPSNTTVVNGYDGEIISFHIVDDEGIHAVAMRLRWWVLSRASPSIIVQVVFSAFFVWLPSLAS